MCIKVYRIKFIELVEEGHRGKIPCHHLFPSPPSVKLWLSLEGG